MFRFANEIWLYVLLVVPALVLLFWLNARWRKRIMTQLGDSNILENLMPTYSKALPRWKRFLFALGLTFLLVGIANPQIGTKYEEVKREGFELMICLDVSNSMLAEDLTPNRLERAKQAISRLVDRLKNDKIGVIVFAGEAYIQLPMTVDHSAAKLFLRSINTGVVATQGTAIGKSIELAMNSFSSSSKANRSIIVITDGENHEDDALQQAAAAVEQGISVHTIGIGSVDGTPIPMYKRGQMLGYRKDREGNTVVTKLNETMLQQIAASGEGTYVRANNSRTGLNALMDELEGMQREEYGSKMFTSYEDRFQYFIAVALVLLLLELLLPSRKLKFLGNSNMFQVKKEK
ncbi:MAG: VWA domain-containing protein [Flavobacteriales bacterium]|jgi:Ca-activated chloride channel family protein|nr:VWA domain-containing protein [Flavobacteriales bacterium]